MSTFLGTQGIPELLRVPDLAGSAGRGSVPSYPAPESAVRALARAVTYSRWVHRPPGRVRWFEDLDVGAARVLMTRLLREMPEGGPLSDEHLRELLQCYGIVLIHQERVATLDEAVAAGARYGWNVVLKAAAPHLQDRPDLSHVWRNIGDEDGMRSAWASLTALVGPEAPDVAEFVVQPMSHSGIPVAIGTLEDPLFGPIVSFGMAGTASELLGDQAFRIPPLTELDAADIVRDVKAAPLFFGYRGSDPVNVSALEELIQRVARLKDDLPEVQALDLGLVLVGSESADVLRATGRVTPMNYVRSDWYTRRLGGPSGTEDTLVG